VKTPIGFTPSIHREDFEQFPGRYSYLCVQPTDTLKHKLNGHSLDFASSIRNGAGGRCIGPGPAMGTRVLRQQTVMRITLNYCFITHYISSLPVIFCLRECSRPKGASKLNSSEREVAMISQCDGGLKVSTPEYTRSRGPTGRELWSEEFARLILSDQFGLKRFLPSVHIADANTAVFSKIDGPYEVVATSQPYLPSKGVPASERRELISRVSKFVDTMKSGTPDARSLGESFVLPDPVAAPELYRLYGTGRARRLIVLWGCSTRDVQLMSPLTAIRRLKVDYLYSVRKFAPLLAAAVAIVLATGLWYVMAHQGGSDVSKNASTATATTSQLVKSTQKAATRPNLTENANPTNETMASGMARGGSPAPVSGTPPGGGNSSTPDSGMARGGDNGNRVAANIPSRNFEIVGTPSQATLTGTAKFSLVVRDVSDPGAHDFMVGNWYVNDKKVSSGENSIGYEGHDGENVRVRVEINYTAGNGNTKALILEAPMGVNLQVQSDVKIGKTSIVTN